MKSKNLSYLLNHSTHPNFFVGYFGLLPEHYTDALIEQIKLKEYDLLDFYALFNQSTLRLLNSMERSLHYSKMDKVLNVFSLHTPLAYYANLFAFHLRSKQALMQLVSTYIKIPCYDILRESIRVKLKPSQCTHLSQKNHFNVLGFNSLLGSRAVAQEARFIFLMGPITEAGLNTLLQKEPLNELHQLIRYYISDSACYRLCLKINFPEVALNRSKLKLVLLGWNSWLGEKRPKSPGSIEISQAYQ